MEVVTLGISSPIKIGYYDPFNIYPKIKEDLDSKFPLTNLHWKYSNGPLRSIPSLEVSLVEEIPKPSSNLSLKTDFAQQPYIRFMFLECDTIDTYRTKVRPFIREWFKTSVENQSIPIEWMLIFYVPDTAKDINSTTFKTSVFDKVKLDFNHIKDSSSKIDRCVKIKQSYPSNMVKMESYNGFVSALKDKLLSSFNARFTEIQNELVKFEADKNTESFVVHDYFLTKINLSETFNDMRLCEDSLSKYNELERELKEMVRKGQSFAPEFGFDEELSFKEFVLEESVNAKALKENLVLNKATIFDLKLFIFIRQALLIQSLAKFASSVSISALHISELLSRLCHFINEIISVMKSQRRNLFKVAEWAYVVIDSFLKLPAIDILDENNNPVEEVAEFRGQARLLQRSQLVILGTLHGYHVKGLMMNLTSETMLVPDTPSSGYSLSYQPLLQMMELESNFEQGFRKLTESAIEDYTLCNRPRSVDTLCTDIALLDYQHGRYENAIEILASCPSFYTDQGWNRIGSYLLEIYIECLEKLKSEDHSLLLKAYLDVFSNISAVNGSAHNRIMKSKAELIETFEQIKKHSSLIEETLTYPIEKLLDFEIFPYVSASEISTENTYYIEIDFKNIYLISMDIDIVELCIVNSAGEKMCFTSNDVQLTGGSNRLKLYTSDLICGDFQLYQLKLSLNQLVLSRFINEDYLIKYEKIAVYPNTSKLWCELLTPRRMDLGSKALLLKVYNGESTLSDVQFILHPISSDIQTLHSEILAYTNSEKLKVLHDKTQSSSSSFRLSKIESSMICDILIPYKISATQNSISYKVEITYKIENETYSYVFLDTVDTTLTVAVSVQDIFKASNLFSKFSVGTSDAQFPIRIMDTELTTKSKYTISAPSKADPLIAFGEQPSTFFYKIEPHSDHKIRSTDTLDLEISYRNLKEECLLILNGLFTEMLKKEGFAKYQLLLSSIIKQVDFHLITYALRSMVIIKGFDILKHSEVFSHCTPSDRLKIMNLIEDFMNKSNYKVDHKIVDYSHIDRKLFISVPVPVVQVIHVARFDFVQESQYIVGEPIEMTLHVTSTNKWRSEEPSDDAHSETPDGKTKKKVLFETNTDKIEQFSLELEGFEDWLISGKKKIRFDIDHTKSDELTEQTIHLISIPLKVGRLSLPKLEIKSINNYLNDEFVMEIDYKNISQTILVVPELDRVTFAF